MSVRKTGTRPRMDPHARRCGWANLVKSVPFDARYITLTLCEVLASAPMETGLGIYAEHHLKSHIRPASELRASDNGGAGQVMHVPTCHALCIRTI